MNGRIFVSIAFAAALASGASAQGSPAANAAFTGLKNSIEAIRSEDSFGRHHKYALTGKPCASKLTQTRWNDDRPARSESVDIDWSKAGPFEASYDDVKVTTPEQSFGLFMGSGENADKVAAAMTALAAACR